VSAAAPVNYMRADLINNSWADFISVSVKPE
jgi:hypothetical protein